MIAGDIKLMGDGNVIGNYSTARVTKEAAQRPTQGDFLVQVARACEMLRATNLSGDDRSTVEANLKTIEKEVEKITPRLPAIESSLRSISGDSLPEKSKDRRSGGLIRSAPLVARANARSP